MCVWEIVLSGVSAFAETQLAAVSGRRPRAAAIEIDLTHRYSASCSVL